MDEGKPGEGTATGPTEKAVPQDERIATIVFAAVLTLFGIFWIWASSDLPDRQQTAYLSQGFLPITAGILLAGLSALLLISTWLAKGRPAAALGKSPVFTSSGERLAAGVFVALLVYIIALPHVHYFLSTLLLNVAGLALAGESPRRPRLYIIATAMTAIFYAIFVYGIQLPLPGSQFV
jgi:hypothetical protein